MFSHQDSNNDNLMILEKSITLRILTDFYYGTIELLLQVVWG